MSLISRRSFVGASGLMLAGLTVPWTASANSVATIHMKSNEDGSHVWFDPIGLYVEPGTTIRWILDGNIHTATAYHPTNDGHSLRIPEGAEPWDSGYLMMNGASFEATLTVPGVYDYYCAPHEHGGMVGRIVVGAVSGPGAGPFDESVPELARCAFPKPDDIMQKKMIPASAPVGCS